MTRTALLLWLTIILSSTGFSERSVVSFNPNWRRIFAGDSMTMTCEVEPTARGQPIYNWYKAGVWFHTGQSFTIKSTKTGDSGDYSCQGGNTERSDTARLEVIYDWVILQVPLYVTEGDDLTLRCHHYGKPYTRNTIFCKDNSVIQDWSSESELQVSNVAMTHAGTYKCTKEIHNSIVYNKFSDEVSIYVQELFSIPEIKLSPHQVVEGDHITLTCDARLSPHRRVTDVDFAFYRDGREVQGFDFSNRYEVQFFKMEDSGVYFCDVRSSTCKVKKRSQEILVGIQELFPNPKISVIPYPEVEGDSMNLTCDTSPSHLATELRFAFYRDRWQIRGWSLNNQYGVQSAQLEDSGNYSCEVRASSSMVNKRSESLYIHIGLFPTPKLEVTPNPVVEGNRMTLTCNTSLSPLRPRTRLQFAFYRDGEEVRGFDVSDQYVVQSSQLEDCGNYSCEVKPTADTFKKSDAISVEIIKGNMQLTSVVLYTLLVMALATVLLATVLLLVKCRHKLRCLNRGQHQVSDREFVNVREVSYAILNLQNAPQGSVRPIKVTKSADVAYATVKSRRVSS